MGVNIDKIETAPKELVSGAKKFWNTLGPGLTTGAADDDPSGIVTYSQTGAQFGFKLLWLAPYSMPLTAIVQEMCARIGLVTGRGLAGNIRIHFPKWVLYSTTFLLLFTNSFNIGADLGAMAKSVELIFPQISFTSGLIIFTIFSLLLQIFTTYREYAKYLKWLTLVLFAYILTAFSIKGINWLDIIKSSITPSLDFSKEQIYLITAILGTTISPYLFFWQTSQEVEEEIESGKTNIALREGATDKEIKSMRIDVFSGMFFSNLIMFFIIAACGATLFKDGITDIGTAADAANALRPFVGDWAYTVFALGVIGTGMLAVPVLAAGAAYALAESFKWNFGLSKKFHQAIEFYGVIIFATLLGLGMNTLGFDPIKSLIYSSIINALISPILIALIILISSNKKIMKNRVNHPVVTYIGWVIVILMSAAGLATIYSFV